MSADPSIVLSGLALANPYVGQGVYSLRLIEGLTRQFSGNFLVVAPAAIARPQQLPAKNFLAMPPLRTPKNSLVNHAIVSERLLRFVRREFPNSVFHSPGPILGSTKPARTVVTLHDCINRHFANYDGRFFIRRMLLNGSERFAASSSLVLTDSEFSRRDLIAKAGIPENKIQILFPWVGNEFLQPIAEESVEALRQKFALPNRFWLYLGGYDYRKNVGLLIEAYAAAARSRRLPPLALAGQIPERRHRALCDVQGAIDRSGLRADQILRIGLVPAPELPALYRATTLLIYPSLMEGFGLPPAEAIAVGTPVLASNASSLPEVVNNRECLFDPQSSGALTDKLLEAANDPQQFKADLSSNFTESYGLGRYLKLINGLANQPDS